MRYIIYGSARQLELCSAAVLGLMMLHVVADVIGRQFFSTPAPATTEVVAFYYMVAIVFLPLPFIELRNQNIVVDVLYEAVPTTIKRIFSGLSEVVCIVFFGLMTFASADHAVEAYIKGEMVQGYYQVIIWPSRFALPLSFGLVAFILVIRLISGTLLQRPLLASDRESSAHNIEDASK